MKPIKSLGYVTPRDYSAYVRFNILKGKYYRIKLIFLGFGLFALCATLAFFGLASSNKSFFIAAGAILLSVVMFFYTVNVNVKRICNSNAKTVRAKQRAEFGKNGFVLDLLFQNEEENEHSEIFYDELDKVYFAPKAIYLYIEKRSVIIIPKRNIDIAPIEARAFLEKFIPAQKLVVCV